MTLTVATTEPGIQVCDDRPGCHGLAIEPQGRPYAPNHPNFPGIDLDPGQPYRQTTDWRFTGL